MSWSEFSERRKNVLESWPTGEEVDLTRALQRHAGLPEAKSVPAVLCRAAEDRVTLTQPRSGVALIEDHMQLIRHLQDEGRADLLSTTVDSYTRHNRYSEAGRGLEESETEGRSMLNGLPVVNYGVARCSEIIDALEKPVQIRHGSPDGRLLAEISYAAGFTAYEGGAISYCLPYTKSISLERAIEDWKYVDRLTGHYENEGVCINREPFGALTGTLVPPCISHAVSIIEALLAAEQGVRNITVGYGQCGNLAQDVAALMTLQEMTDEHLMRAGFSDVEVTTVLHQWMGAFPPTESEALSVIAWGGVAAAAGRATKVITKSVHEAKGIPTAEANAQGLRVSRAAIDLVCQQDLASQVRWEEEAEVIRREVESIMQSVYYLSDGDLGQGAQRSVQAGIIDVPFSPHISNRGESLPIRDGRGAVRLLACGEIPIPDDVRAYHQECIAARLADDGRPEYELVLDDVTAVQAGKLVGSPPEAN